MINQLSLSAIITTYRRMDTIGDVCRAWLTQPADQVWLIDGSGGKARKQLGKGVMECNRFEYWPLHRDHGTRTDYAMAHLTDGDIIILADDDVVPEEGFTEQLWKGMSATEADIVGIIGRTFHGPRYYHDTKYCRADAIREPVRVGFVGVVCMARRYMFGFDTRGMGRNIDDLWWQMEHFPDATKMVIPTKAYRDLPSAKHGMFHDRGELHKQREHFYRECYEEHYAPKGLQW